MSRAKAVLAGLVAMIPVNGQSAPPRLQPVADTKLLMEGLAHPNFKAVDRLLKEDLDDEGWQLARGQSLLIAETANLLMMRPPKTAKAEDAWMSRSTELRDASGKLAKTTAAKDLAKSKAALLNVANACNRCHESFRVEVKIKAGEK